MNCEYIQKHYGVPACIGRRVIAGGEPGIIAEDRGAHIGVMLDKDKPTQIHSYHPTDEIVYGKMGHVRQMTRSQKRYREYLELADCFESFKAFLKWKSSEADREAASGGEVE